MHFFRILCINILRVIPCHKIPEKLIDCTRVSYKWLRCMILQQIDKYYIHRRICIIAMGASIKKAFEIQKKLHLSSCRYCLKHVYQRCWHKIGSSKIVTLHNKLFVGKIRAPVELCSNRVCAEVFVFYTEILSAPNCQRVHLSASVTSIHSYNKLASDHMMKMLKGQGQRQQQDVVLTVNDMHDRLDRPHNWHQLS